MVYEKEYEHRPQDVVDRFLDHLEYTPTAGELQQATEEFERGKHRTPFEKSLDFAGRPELRGRTTLILAHLFNADARCISDRWRHDPDIMRGMFVISASIDRGYMEAQRVMVETSGNGTSREMLEQINLYNIQLSGFLDDLQAVCDPNIVEGNGHVVER